MKRTLICAMFLGGCLQTAGQPFPTSNQLKEACLVETQKGTPARLAPDCGAHFAIQMACNAEALGPTINPLVSMVNPIAGSILTVQATINKQLCESQGFYK